MAKTAGEDEQAAPWVQRSSSMHQKTRCLPSLRLLTRITWQRVQPRSLEVLDDLGVVDEIIANGRFAFIDHPESAPQVKDYLRRFAPINDAKMPSTPLIEDHLL
jgi:hypothetical protein